MKILVHNSPTTLAAYKTKFPNLGILSSPRRFYKAEEGIENWLWAADNDAYSNWDEGRFRAMLEGIRYLRGCVFATAPDVVGDAHETLRRFDQWRPEMNGLPVALVAQDGLQHPPWDHFDALFIGGTTNWKMGNTAASLAKEAKQRGKWLHMGRVNSHQRIRYARALGCDSIDGASLSWFRDTYLTQFLQHAAGPPQLLLDDV